jgi:phosphogluconate dehydratase
MFDERALVNAIVGLLATGGSTNHTIHLIAIARAAGLLVNWDDFSELSAVVPLLARIYPNGSADVNHFHAAGGMSFLIRELLTGGLLHADVHTVMGPGLQAYSFEPRLEMGEVRWRKAPERSGDLTILRPLADAFSADGGLKLLQGNLGRAVIKTSAVQPQHRRVQAPARVFDSQEAVARAFEADELRGDLVIVVRFQGPRANGMPELHGLTPLLSVLQKRGQCVALLTDGRMSGASGSVPAAIHMTPECLAGGALSRVRDGDEILLDSYTGRLEAQVPAELWQRRDPPRPELSAFQQGLGRELFGTFRRAVSDAETGAVACTSPI